MKLARFSRRAATPEPTVRVDYPELAAKHMSGASLYADRRDLLASLASARGGIIAEVGVATGDFSDFMLTALVPTQFVAFDNFRMHETPVVWGVPSRILLAGMTHLEFYRRRFGAYRDQMTIEVGASHAGLARYRDEYFDLIYIDADHAYEGVKGDAEIGKTKLKPGGFLVFNDYVLVDHVSGQRYGVIQAVNELVVAEDWHVVGFALQHHMFCDIAIRKPVR